jgi:two-component system CheB/CheR fusion protein
MTKENTGTELPIVVGIGSSAGGLEAIRELAASLPLNNGCAYVVVQHMSPQHKSLMTSLIATETELKVIDIEDAMVPEPDVIYVTPPRADIVMADGKLRLVPHSEDLGKPKPSVDRFLMTLAQDRGARTMGVILSGTGSDGAYGVQAIREAGGITIAQDDASAKYDGMPNAAIATGCVDLILRPSDIATHLNKIMTSPRDLDQFRSDSGEVSPVSGILQIVLARTRVDFREYKQSTVLRRIDRRMMALGIVSVEDYVVYCRNEPREVDALFKDLLISVTRFFRDRDEFDDLEHNIQDLVDQRGDRPLRIWVAGCATGEEVYSIAIMLAEAMGGAAELVKSKTQIFATDIDRAALDYARLGQYSQGALLDVPKELSDKYFIQQSEGVRVIEALRSVILFSDHNLCQDPPFLNMDLICCRNLLIYFSSKLQSRVFARLHYALKQDAILFLGTAETVTGSDQLFSEVGDNPHIFRKKALRKIDQTNPKAFAGTWSPPATRGARPKPEARPMETERLMFDALARSLGENAVLVSADHSFLRVYGDITPYVNLSESSSLNLQLSLLKSPFREEARSLVTLALKHNQRRVGAKHDLGDDKDTLVRLEVIPVKASAIDESLALLVINTWSKSDIDRVSGETATGGVELSESHLRELDDELATTREALQQTIEELETSNEELQSLNEELQSTNEELQATNEELETSNEELQSTNEELITVNEELQVNSSELMGLNAELGSLLGNVPIPLLVLDNALQIARASQSALRLFDIPTPLRSPHLSQVNLPDGFPRLVEICNEALQLGTPISRDFNTTEGPYTLQCAPFTGDAGQMIGTTLVFLRSPAVQSLANELQQLLTRGPIYLLQHDEDSKVTRISSQMAEILGVSMQEAIGLSVERLLVRAGVPADNGLRQLLDGKPHDGAFQLWGPEGDAVWISARRHAYTDPGTGQVIVVILGQDVTEIIKVSNVVDISNNSLKLMESLAETGYWRVDLSDKKLHWSAKVFEIHGEDPAADAPSLEDGINAYHPDDRDMVQGIVDRAFKEGVGYEFRARLLRSGGDAIWVRALSSVVRNSSGEPISLVGSFRDITTEMANETRLAEIETIIDRDDIGFYSYDVLTDTAYWSPSCYRVLRLNTKKAPSFKLIHSLVDAGDQDRFLEHRKKTLAKGTPYEDDFKLTTGDGRKRIMTVNMSATTNDEGTVTNYYGSITVRDRGT